MPERHFDSILDKFRKKAVKPAETGPAEAAKAEKENETAFTEEENKRLEGYLLLAKEKERSGDQRGAYELYVKYKKEFIEIKIKSGKESAEAFPPEYLEALSEVFKGEKLDLMAMLKAEELTEEYFAKMYPTEQRGEDTARGLTSYRPSWWNGAVNKDMIGPDEETWGQAYERSMRTEAEQFKESVIFTESIQKPKYTNGTQQYGTAEGKDADKDPLLPIIQEVFGDKANRFKLSWDQITNELLPKVKEKIKDEFVNKHITVPDFEVILTPAIISNLQTTLNHPENSQTNTYEWTSTILLKQDGTDSGGYRLMVGYSGNGGAGYVNNAHRGSRWDGRGFRLSVVFEK